MDPIRKIYERLHLSEEISKLKYSLVCYAPLTSFRTFIGGVVRRVYCYQVAKSFDWQKQKVKIDDVTSEDGNWHASTILLNN